MTTTRANSKSSRVYYRTCPSFDDAKELVKALAKQRHVATVTRCPAGGFDVFVPKSVLSDLRGTHEESHPACNAARIASSASDNEDAVDYREVAAALDKYAIPTDGRSAPKRVKRQSGASRQSSISASPAQVSGRALLRPEEHPNIDYEEVAAALDSYAITVDANGHATIDPIPSRLLNSHQTRQLLKEIQMAYRSAPSEEVEAWAVATAKRFPMALTRRISNLAGVATTLVQGVGRETLDLWQAIQEGRVAAHICDRATSASAATSKQTRLLLRKAATLAKALRENPKELGPELLVMSMAFYYAGGGLDGDGGIPDQDIRLFGIGGHRSIWTHSILAGAFVDTGLFSLYDFLMRAHKYLPQQHDPIWDIMKERLDGVTLAAMRGSSMGVAYHLGIDATLQPAAYHDLPFSASMDVHREIMGANALAEGMSVKQGRTNADDAQQIRGDDRRFAEIATGALAVLAGAIAIFAS